MSEESHESKIGFRPLTDWVVIEPISENETPGGIALPEGVQEDDAQRGRVLRVGPGRETESGETVPAKVNVGDVVYLFFAYSKPIAVTLGGRKVLVARVRDLIGVCE